MFWNGESKSGYQLFVKGWQPFQGAGVVHLDAIVLCLVASELPFAWRADRPGSGAFLVFAHFPFTFSPSSTKPTPLIEHSMTFVGEHGHFVAHFNEAHFDQGP